MTKIIIDTREQQEKVINALKRLDIELEFKTLPYCDYILSEDTVVERKSIGDLLSSMTKLWPEFIEATKYYDNVILMIEGTAKPVLKSNQDFHYILYPQNSMPSARFWNPLTVETMIFKMQSHLGISRIHTETPYHTALQLHALAKNLQKDKDKKPKGIRMKKKVMTVNERYQFLVEGLPGVSGVMSQALLEKFGTPFDIFNASATELKEVRGLSDNKIKRIFKALGKNYDANK